MQTPDHRKGRTREKTLQFTIYDLEQQFHVFCGKSSFPPFASVKIQKETKRTEKRTTIENLCALRGYKRVQKFLAKRRASFQIELP